MPILILIAALFLIGFCLYRFLLNAAPHQVKALLLSAAAIGIALASLFLAVTGRLPAAVGILIALWPLGLAWLRSKPRSAPPESQASVNLTKKEAYEVLGLPPSASVQEIHEAHIRLMKKVHPDQKGSEWLAKKINAAKDLLLKDRM